jgi:membrane protein implicated in regulation of membrane protease activity
VTVLLDDHAWIAWLALIVTGVVVEMRRLDLMGLCGGVAALAALLSGLLGAHWWLQAVVALVAAAALLGSARPALLRALPVEGRRERDDLGPGGSSAVPDDGDRPA